MNRKFSLFEIDIFCNNMNVFTVNAKVSLHTFQWKSIMVSTKIWSSTTVFYNHIDIFKQKSKKKIHNIQFYAVFWPNKCSRGQHNSLTFIYTLCTFRELGRTDIISVHVHYFEKEQLGHSAKYLTSLEQVWTCYTSLEQVYDDIISFF